MKNFNKKIIVTESQYKNYKHLRRLIGGIETLIKKYLEDEELISRLFPSGATWDQFYHTITYTVAVGVLNDYMSQEDESYVMTRNQLIRFIDIEYTDYIREKFVKYRKDVII